MYVGVMLVGLVDIGDEFFIFKDVKWMVVSIDGVKIFY